MVSIDNISVTYDKRHDVLNGVTLKVGKGEIVAVVGRNGSGKSTLLKTIVGDVFPYEGSVWLGGVDVSKVRRRDIAKKVAYVEQSLPSIEMTVRQYVMLGRTVWGGMLKVGCSLDDMKIVEASIEMVGMSALAEKRMDSISGGEQQLCTIARAIAQQTPLICLDEPTSSLDVSNQQQVIEIVRELKRAGKTIVVVVHDLNSAAAIADRIAVLKKGKLVAYGRTSETMTEKVLSDAFETDMRIVRIDDKNKQIFVPENLLNICEKV